MQKASTQQVVGFRQEIRQLLERRLLATVEAMLEEELGEALGCGGGTAPVWSRAGSRR